VTAYGAQETAEDRRVQEFVLRYEAAARAATSTPPPVPRLRRRSGLAVLTVLGVVAGTLALGYERPAPTVTPGRPMARQPGHGALADPSVP
jgi:hypothetical protein